MTARLMDIELAIDFVSSSFAFDNEAFLDTESGKIYYIGDASEELLPDDINDSDKYLLIPSKSELGLGKQLAIEFTSQELPNEIDKVYSIFRRKGAYARFKSLLESTENLEKWYSFEETSVKVAILEWCKEHNVGISSDT